MAVRWQALPARPPGHQTEGAPHGRTPRCSGSRSRLSGQAAAPVEVVDPAAPPSRIRLRPDIPGSGQRRCEGILSGHAGPQRDSVRGPGPRLKPDLHPPSRRRGLGLRVARAARARPRLRPPAPPRRAGPAPPRRDAAPPARRGWWQRPCLPLTRYRPAGRRAWRPVSRAIASSAVGVTGLRRRSPPSPGAAASPAPPHRPPLRRYRVPIATPAQAAPARPRGWPRCPARRRVRAAAIPSAEGRGQPSPHRAAARPVSRRQPSSPTARCRRRTGATPPMAHRALDRRLGGGARYTDCAIRRRSLDPCQCVVAAPVRLWDRNAKRT